MNENRELSLKIAGIIEFLKLKKTDISFAIINLKTILPEISGFNMDAFIYPASVYKVFISAEILRQVSEGLHHLDEILEIEPVNAVDTHIHFFPKGIKRDSRPLLKAGDKVSIDYLLDLIFTRSDNTAANTLLDLVGRESINTNIIEANNWTGSGVTRKFLDRLKEDKKYRFSDITVSSARHLVELMCKIESKTLCNVFVSGKLKEYMTRWNRGGRTGLYIPEFTQYYRKGGWLEINGYKINFVEAMKNVWKKGYAVNRWSNDVGVVTGEKSHYAISILTLTKSKWPWVVFPMKKFSKQVFDLMESQ